MRQAEFCKLTGATPRQIDYWTSIGIELCETEIHGGKGHYRSYKREAVEPTKLILNVQNCFGGRIEIQILKEIFDNYLEEHVKVGRVWLTWRCDRNARAHASSERGA